MNSNIDKFVESIKCFINFKTKAENKGQPESQLIELVKEQIANIDEKALHSRTWWGQVMDNSMEDWDWTVAQQNFYAGLG